MPPLWPGGNHWFLKVSWKFGWIEASFTQDQSSDTKPLSVLWKLILTTTLEGKYLPPQSNSSKTLSRTPLEPIFYPWLPPHLRDYYWWSGCDVFRHCLYVEGSVIARRWFIAITYKITFKTDEAISLNKSWTQWDCRVALKGSSQWRTQFRNVWKTQWRQDKPIRCRGFLLIDFNYFLIQDRQSLSRILIIIGIGRRTEGLCPRHCLCEWGDCFSRFSGSQWRSRHRSSGIGHRSSNN